ncbi:MAG: hypothetical protein L0J57_11320 [Brachybacterium sp.]|nr:hypothetical protein [Brachybacterium sp.]
MCRPVPCATCGRTTWAGCGEHIEQALEGVPTAERCPGHADVAPTKGFFARVLGR